MDQNKKNVIFILVDDLGWKDLGCYGSNFHETPNIDALAKDGMQFTQAYAASPVCSPTRASILTGKYPVNVGITDWIPGRQANPNIAPPKLTVPEFEQELSLEQTTIAEELNNAGYVTAHIGKWHLGDSAFYPEYNGFDLNVAGRDFGSPPDYFWPYEQVKNGKVKKALSGLKALGQEGDYLTDALTTEALEFISLNSNRGFFLSLSYYSVHIPLQAKEKLIAKYEEKLTTDTVYTHDNPVYAAMIETLDKNIGRLNEKLLELGLADNTIIILTSDNGGLTAVEGPHTPATTNYPLKEGKGHIYEGGIRVPLIIVDRGDIQPGSIQPNYVSSIDFFPTMLDWLKIETDKTVDGRSFTTLLQNKSWGPQPLFWHYPHYSNQGGMPASAIRLEDYKLIEFYEDGHLELYNLKDDPGEMVNLINAIPEKAIELKNLLDSWKQENNVKIPE